MGRFLGFIPLPDTQKFTSSKGYEFFARKAFDQCDVDNNGKLNVQEVYIALLLLYDQLNSKLPCHIKVPNKVEATALFLRHDKDSNGSIAFDEFLEMSKEIMAHRSWRDSIWVKIGIALLMKTAVWPAVAAGAKTGMLIAGVPGAGLLPTSAMSGSLETLGKTVGAYVGFH